MSLRIRTLRASFGYFPFIFVSFLAAVACAALRHIFVPRSSCLRSVLLNLCCSRVTLAGFGRSGCLSDSDSSDDEQLASPLAVSRHMRQAAHDLLSRPDGMSLRRLEGCLRASFGPLDSAWADFLASDGPFEVFSPVKRSLPPLLHPETGCIYSDAKRHAGAVHVPCFRSHALANPWPVGDLSLDHVVELCNDLMVYGGRAIDWHPGVHPAYAAPDADARREAELDRVALLVAEGASVSLRCSASCEQRRRALPSSPCHVPGVAVALRGRVQSLLQSRRDAVPPASASGAVASRLHVRRVVPPDWPIADSVVGADRFERAAVLAAAPSGGDAVRSSPLAAVRVGQPFAFAGAANVHVEAQETPSAFSHRRMERMPDGECLLLPFPVTNAPPVLPFEDPIPVDPPSGIVAYDVSEVVPRDDLRAYCRWARRADRSIELAGRGHARNARAARPDDLLLTRTMPRFDGVNMDFSSYPFRPLLPSRWPDRPPSTDLRLRHVRREFQAHPDYPDRQLRGSLSHGNPEVGPCSRVSFFAAPHASAYEHGVTWLQQMKQERDYGWGEAGFPRSFGLATWPQRCQPTSMVERLGKWRLCHDLSWPPRENVMGVESPNEADEFTLVLVFLAVGQLCVVAAVYLAAGLPVRVWYFDLSKAYKRTGQQRSTRWRRTCWSEHRSQTLDRVAFGQTDGPSSFTRQSSFQVFVMRRELAYADRCYPSRDDRVLAFVRFRRRMVPAGRGPLCGETPPDSLTYVGAMIDDFGGVTVDDLLFRADGTPVLEPSGAHKTRSWLAFEVCASVALRFGHVLEPDDPGKYWRPREYMLYLGAKIDLGAEELCFDSDGANCKRERYLAHLSELLLGSSVRPTVLTSVAFKMLVVCECYPYGRQWLHPLFRSIRGNRTAPIVFETEPGVLDALVRFRDLLASDVRLAVPLASRQSFPFAESEDVLVSFADASGRNRPGEVADGKPGYGAWSVRARTLYIVHGLWTFEELELLSISVLEFVISYWAAVIFVDVAPGVSHLLEFSDNTGAEWSMRRETPSTIGMQTVAQRRSAFLREHGLFSRVARVASSDNKWADWLSRQGIDRVYSEAAMLGLRVVRLHVPSELRDLAWLLSVVAQA